MDQLLVSNEGILLLIRKCRSPIWMFARYSNLRCKPIYVFAQVTNHAKVKVLPLTYVGEHFWHLAMRSFHSHGSPILCALFGLAPCWKQCHGSHQTAAVGTERGSIGTVHQPPTPLQLANVLNREWKRYYPIGCKMVGTDKTLHYPPQTGSARVSETRRC
jgi:hypothetical protein